MLIKSFIERQRIKKTFCEVICSDNVEVSMLFVYVKPNKFVFTIPFASLETSRFTQRI